MEPGIEFEVSTWNRSSIMLLSQAEKTRSMRFKLVVIIGVTRGGWIIARVLSDFLGVERLATIRAAFYIGVAKTAREPVLAQRVFVNVAGKRALLVNDIADTDRSLKLAKEHLQQQNSIEVSIATVHLKSSSVTNPDYYKKETELWVIFPWDAKETVMKIIEKHDYAKSTELAKLMKGSLSKHLIRESLKQDEVKKC